MKSRVKKKKQKKNEININRKNKKNYKIMREQNISKRRIDRI